MLIPVYHWKIESLGKSIAPAPSFTLYLAAKAPKLKEWLLKISEPTEALVNVTGELGQVEVTEGVKSTVKLYVKIGLHANPSL